MNAVRVFTAQSASNAPCEDAMVTEVLSDGSVLAAVFDGHNGEQTARFCCGRLKGIVERRLLQEREAPQHVVGASLTELDELWLAHVLQSGQLYLLGTQGTCASLVLLHKGQLYSSYVGDSRMLVGVVPSSSNVAMTVALQRHEHSARDLEERERLEAIAGSDRRDTLFVRRDKVAYVRGHIQTTRSVGDHYLRDARIHAAWSGVTGDAESWKTADLGLVTCVPETDHDDLEDAAFVLICSDGIFDYMSEDLAVDFVHRNLATSADVAKDLLHFCMVKVTKLLRNFGV